MSFPHSGQRRFPKPVEAPRAGREIVAEHSLFAALSMSSKNEFYRSFEWRRYQYRIAFLISASRRTLARLSEAETRLGFRDYRR